MELDAFTSRLGLGQGTGKAVQQPALGLGFLQGLENHGNGDLVGNQIAALDKGLGLHAQLGAALDVFAEDGA